MHVYRYFTVHVDAGIDLASPAPFGAHPQVTLEDAEALARSLREQMPNARVFAVDAGRPVDVSAYHSVEDGFDTAEIVNLLDTLGLTAEGFVMPSDPDVFARMVGRDGGFKLVAAGEAGPVFACMNECATVWWPDVNTFETVADDGRRVVVVHVDRYVHANGGIYCGECEAVPFDVEVDAGTLDYVGPHSL